jgi:hypothetical protein
VFNGSRRTSDGYPESLEARRSKAGEDREERNEASGCAESDHEILWWYDVRHETCWREETPQDVGGWQAGDFQGYQGTVGQDSRVEKHGNQDTQDNQAQDLGGSASEDGKGTKSAVGGVSSCEGQDSQSSLNITETFLKTK